MITFEPIDFSLACVFTILFHRHHLPPQGWMFGFGAFHDGVMIGAITIGRPVSRHYNDTNTLEVTRCCTDGTPHVCSMLYAAVFRAARALKYDNMITYTLESEHGTSLVAAGWGFARLAGGGEWSSPSRPRAKSVSPTCRKKLWYKSVLPANLLPSVIIGSAAAVAKSKKTPLSLPAKTKKSA